MQPAFIRLYLTALAGHVQIAPVDGDVIATVAKRLLLRLTDPCGMQLIQLISGIVQLRSHLAVKTEFFAGVERDFYLMRIAVGA